MASEDFNELLDKFSSAVRTLGLRVCEVEIMSGDGNDKFVRLEFEATASATLDDDELEGLWLDAAPMSRQPAST